MECVGVDLDVDVNANGSGGAGLLSKKDEYVQYMLRVHYRYLLEGYFESFGFYLPSPVISVCSFAYEERARGSYQRECSRLGIGRVV